MRTQGTSVAIVTTRETGGGIGIGRVSADVDHAQSAQLPDSVEARTEADSGVVEPFSDPEGRKAGCERGDALSEDGAFVGVSGIQGAAQGPGNGEAVVENPFGDTAVAEDVSAFGVV